MLRRSSLLALSLAVLVVPTASAHHPAAGAAANQVPARAFGAAMTEPCPGDPIAPDQVIAGDFGRDLMKGYVLVPFDVPAGTTAVRVKYCYDKPDTPLSSQVNHTLDLGLYEPRDGGAPWGPDEFRGWGGSSHPDVTVSAEGFSSEAEYEARPKGHVPGKTTRGFRPGSISPGQWAAELGVAAVVSQAEGDSDGRVAWRLELEFAKDAAFADEPYKAARYPTKPVKREAGWYAGDMHVHAEHSALGDATMSEVFGFAFQSRADGGAGLDWITLSDYVSGSSWGEIGRYQPNYPGKLIMRSAEVITYEGHLNSHANSTNMDYRAGPLYEWTGSAAKKVRDAQPPRGTFDRIHAAGGFTQINHPTIFPSSVPLFAGLCRGCPWDHSDEETGYEKVDAWEVHTGPAGNSGAGYRAGPNPFTLTAIERWDELRRAGHRITGVAVSDSHNAGRTNNPVTQAPIGQGTTMVYADELSEEGVQRAIQLGHAFVKLWASDDPDLRLDAVTPKGIEAMMGDPLAETSAKFTARVLNGTKDGQDRQLIVLRDGQEIATVPVTGREFTYEFEGDGAGDYRLQLQRGSAIDALTNPITLGAKLAIKPRLRTRKPRARKTRRYIFDVALLAQDRELPLEGARVRFAGKRATTRADGRAVVSKRVRKRGRYKLVVKKPGLRTVKMKVRVRR